MSECNHDCEHCSQEGCESKITKVTPNERSSFKHCIAVVSGKGGVGKSYVTSLLASYLNKSNLKVGVLDGDIVGPSIPKGFNIHERATGDGSVIFPCLTKNNIKVISSNMLLENEDDPIIWRGVMVSSLLKQFVSDVLWEDLDYLLIDMPPGTSDVTLTAFQSLPLDGIIIVTSPQDLVSLIVTKAIKMAKMMNIKILGIIENMSYVKCSNCNEKIYLYGESKIEEFCKKENLNLLGQLPLIPGQSKLIDEGKVEDIDSNEMCEIAQKVKEFNYD